MATNKKIGTNKGRKGKRALAAVLYIVPLIGLAVFGGYYFMKYNDLKNNPVPAEQAAQAEVDRYKQEVGELYDLPDDEEPSIATVRDKEQLANQPFFAQAENNDVTLIYQNARLAILYRPSTGKLINVSTLSIEDNPRVTVVGPSGKRGEAVASLANVQITASEGTAPAASVPATVVVDVSGENEAAAKAVAEALDAKVATLPKNQEAPENTEILVIVADDATEETAE